MLNNIWTPTQIERKGQDPSVWQPLPLWNYESFWAVTFLKYELWKRVNQEPIRKTIFKRKWYSEEKQWRYHQQASKGKIIGATDTGRP